MAIIAVMVAPALLRAQVAPNLGTAHRFGVLGNSGVTGSTGTGTLVNGDVGSFPTAAVTNFPPSRVGTGFTLHLTANATVQQAQTDAKTAYDFLAAQGGTPIADALSGALTPGVYALGAADLAASTTLTLNGAGIFIFNVASTLTMNVGSVVNGTANPCNVYWRVGTSATLNGTSFMGTVIADASITVGAGSSVIGRVLAGTGPTGAVTMSGAGGNTIGGCSDPLATPTISKAFSPTSILAGGTSQLTITLTNPNASTITLSAAFTDTLPTGLVVAPTPGASTTCGGAVTATPGGATVSLTSDSTLPAAGSCTMSVNVRAAASGSYVNTIPIGALQTSAGNNAAPASATLSVTCPVITLAPTTLPGGRVAVAYSQTITGSGGTAPYTFAVVAGTLPAGLTLTSSGVLAGTPTTAGSSTFTIRGTDANSCSADLVATIVIAAAPVPPPVCPVITLAPNPVPNGTVGVAYSVTMSGSGGTAPYSFGVPLGTLPAGLTLTDAGVLAGTPTTAGSSTFTIRGTDAVGCFAEIVSTVVIAAAPVPPPVCPVITLAPNPLPNGTVGVAYSVAMSGSGGTAPYSFGVIRGALPGGLTLTAAGVLAGTPTPSGASTFTIRGTDAAGCFAEVVATRIIAPALVLPPGCPVITLAPANLPNGLVGQPWSQTLTASGGTAPYTFGVVAGRLPPGLVLSMVGGMGLIAGTPTANGSYEFTIRVTDAANCSAETVDVMAITTAVPTMPVIFVMLLSLILGTLGYMQLRAPNHRQPPSTSWPPVASQDVSYLPRDRAVLCAVDVRTTVPHGKAASRCRR